MLKRWTDSRQQSKEAQEGKRQPLLEKEDLNQGRGEKGGTQCQSHTPLKASKDSAQGLESKNKENSTTQKATFKSEILSAIELIHHNSY